MDVKMPAAFTKGQNVWARNYRHGKRWMQGEMLYKIGTMMY